MGRYKIFALTALSTAVADLATKAMVEASLGLYQVVPVIEGFFNLVHVRNPGGAFSMFSNTGSGRVAFFVGVAIVALAGILWMVKSLKPEEKLENLALALIFGGALGNLADRIRYGEVVDFLEVYYGSFRWPAFNVADIAITCGVLLVFAQYFVRGGNKSGDQA